MARAGETTTSSDASSSGLGEKTRRWLLAREEQSHFSFNRFLLHSLLGAILIMLVLTTYERLADLNQIRLWVLPLGSLALVLETVFLAGTLASVLSQIIELFMSAPNGVRYGALVLILLLLVFGNLGGIITNTLVSAYKSVDYAKIFDIPLEGLGPGGVVIPMPQQNVSQKIRLIEYYIFQYTNEQRQASGLQPLSLSAPLSDIARLHSQDMINRNFFAHENPDGEDPTKRAAKYGYPTSRPIEGGAIKVGIGENIGKMPTGNVQDVGYVNDDAASIARAQVNAWMNSPGHRKNILDGQYIAIGVGVAYDGKYYFSTQDFD